MFSCSPKRTLINKDLSSPNTMLFLMQNQAMVPLI